jgi:hypothetical protein
LIRPKSSRRRDLIGRFSGHQAGGVEVLARFRILRVRKAEGLDLRLVEAITEFAEGATAHEE